MLVLSFLRAKGYLEDAMVLRPQEAAALLPFGYSQGDYTLPVGPCRQPRKM